MGPSDGRGSAVLDKCLEDQNKIRRKPKKALQYSPVSTLAITGMPTQLLSVLANGQMLVTYIPVNMAQFAERVSRR